MDSYKWTHQCWLTSKDLHTSADTGCSFENLPKAMANIDDEEDPVHAWWPIPDAQQSMVT